jgi:hypothetical protein
MRPRSIITLSVLTLSALYTPCQGGLESVLPYRSNSATISLLDEYSEHLPSESRRYDPDGDLNQNVEARQPLPYGGYCQAQSQQDTTVTDGSYGQSILKGRGSASADEDALLSHPYAANSQSFSYVMFTSDHPFEWILDADVSLSYEGNPDGKSEIQLQLSEVLYRRPTQKRWRYVHSCSNSEEQRTQLNRVSGRLPAGKYIFAVTARASINDQKADNPVIEDSAAFAEYFVDLRIKQYPTTDVSRYLTTGNWDRVTDTLLDLGKQDQIWQSDLDGNGKVDVDDVISALERAIEKQGPMPDVKQDAAHQDNWKADHDKVASKMPDAFMKKIDQPGK